MAFGLDLPSFKLTVGADAFDLELVGGGEVCGCFVIYLAAVVTFT